MSNQPAQTPKSYPSDIDFGDQKPTYIATLTDELVRLNAQNIRSPETLIKLLTRGAHEVRLDRFITINPAMIEMKRKVEAILTLPQNKLKPVLITGPSGTGKEIIARAFDRSIECEDPKTNKITISAPFIARNCAGFPKDLICSLLFGHLKGTFTGADRDKDGLFIQAGEGTVFLDEIAELPMEAQAILLRVLQERTVTRLGDIAEQEVKCQVIAATKRNLRDMVEQGTFREDLFARLMTFEIHITGLQERPEDIQLIAAKGYDLENRLLNYTAKIPEYVLPDIYRYNVRAIQAFVARMRTYGSY